MGAIAATPPLVVVLAGGRSRRMGRPKALIPFRGRPLISWPLAAAATAGLEAVVVAKTGSPLPTIAVPVWEEPAEPVHPLTGLVAALERAKDRPVLAVACDMPFLAPGLLHALAEAAPTAAAVAPRVAGRLEPFPARYAPDALPALRDALASQGSLRKTLAALDPWELDEDALRAYGDPARLVASLNTPEEVAASA
jgi:molybdopterin-guanine dinucleotide biosynthesis protein A